MKCATYYEENDRITYQQYENAIRNLMWEENGKIIQDVTMRKLIFGMSSQNLLEENQEGSVVYSICMKDFEWNELYVERKSVRNSLILKSYVKISKKMCERILAKDIKWMQAGKETLLQDFYFETTMNGLAPVMLRETKKDICGNIRDNDCIVFKKSIKRSLDCNMDFFEENLPLTDDYMDCDSVIMSYRRTVQIPMAVSRIIHIGSSNTYTLAHSL